MFEPYLFLIYLLCVMIICNIIKENNLLAPLYELMVNKIKSKKILVFLISCFSGILPIPGRVVISAGILDTVVDKNTPSRHKFGIVNYLSTHHYYWWSPLEKTVIIPMAALGLTYLQFLSYTIVPVFICALFTFYYIFIFLDEKDIQFTKPEQKYDKVKFLAVIPIFTSIVLMCFNIKPYYIFPITLLYYIIYCKEFNVKKIVGYIDCKLILLTLVVIFSSEIIATKSKMLLTQLENIARVVKGEYFIGFCIVSLIAFTITFVLGSSAKYAGIATLLTSLYGTHFLTYFLVLEFFAYIISPTHKCVLIASKYFNTPLKEFYRVLSLWGLILLAYGVLTILIGLR